MTIVQVKPIEKEKWHGVKGKSSFTGPVTIEALVSAKTKKFATGLTQEDRIRLENNTGFNLSPEYTQGVPHEFWNSPAGSVKLENKTNIFDTSIPLDEIKVKVLKASDLVANSQKELEEGKYPKAKFIIFDESEEVEVKAAKAAIKRQTIIESSELTKTRKAEIIQILLGISVRNQSDKYIDLKLDELIDKNAGEVLKLIQRDVARTSLHALVLEAIYKNELKKVGTGIYFMDDQIGHDIESAIDYLQDPKNQILKATILEKIT